MSSPTIGLGHLITLFAVVTSGAVLPMVPTGAAVSVAAALAEHDNVLLTGTVVLVGAAGAYVSDLGTYAVLRLAGSTVRKGSGRLGRWLHAPRQRHLIDRVETQLEAHELRTLLLSRLVPGGQLPVLLAAAVGGYPWRKYALADIGAALLWSLTYTASGVAGRAAFGRPWKGAAAAIALVLLVSAATTGWQRLRRHSVAI